MMEKCLYCGKPTQSHKVSDGYLCHNCYLKRDSNKEIEEIINKSEKVEEFEEIDITEEIDENEDDREDLNRLDLNDEFKKRDKNRDKLIGIEKIKPHVCPFCGGDFCESSFDLPKLRFELGIEYFADAFIEDIVPSKEIWWIRCINCSQEWWQFGNKAFTDVEAFKEKFFNTKETDCPGCGKPIKYYVSKKTFIYDGILYKRYHKKNHEMEPYCKECQEELNRQRRKNNGET